MPPLSQRLRRSLYVLGEFGHFVAAAGNLQHRLPEVIVGRLVSNIAGYRGPIAPIR
jgi:hypothetical protein